MVPVTTRIWQQIREDGHDIAKVILELELHIVTGYHVNAANGTTIETTHCVGKIDPGSRGQPP